MAESKGKIDIYTKMNENPKVGSSPLWLVLIL
jgi:hypothetical protein